MCRDCCGVLVAAGGVACGELKLLGELAESSIPFVNAESIDDQYGPLEMKSRHTCEKCRRLLISEWGVGTSESLS